MELLKGRTGDQKTRKGDVKRVSWVGAGAGGKRLIRDEELMYPSTNEANLSMCILLQF